LCKNIIMKKKLFVSFLNFTIMHCVAQNVGIGTASPSEKLDVNGNINIAGDLKINGNAGSSNQVLMKDASNTIGWGNLQEFKNMQVFDCNNIASSTGASNCLSSWTVPAGVNTVLVECWGGGGGANQMSGGGGGGYISAKLTVTPATAASLFIGAGGNYGSIIQSSISGGNSSFSIGTMSLVAYGGAGGLAGDPFTSVNGSQSSGGTYIVTGITSQFIGYNGSPGSISKLSFMSAGVSDFAKIVNYGDGGDAAILPGSGSKGGYRIVSAAITQSIYSTQFGIQPGGGGGADATGGYYGRGGRIIIHW
jgi:hypothetical protein